MEFHHRELYCNEVQPIALVEKFFNKTRGPARLCGQLEQVRELDEHGQCRVMLAGAFDSASSSACTHCK